MTSVNVKTPKSSDSDVDRYLQESCKSYKECSIKNNARRNSLLKKTLGIESEHRIASAKLSREEKQLREHLHQMNVEKVKNHILHNIREPKRKKKKDEDDEPTKEPLTIPLEPYPVTFSSHSPSPVLDADKHMDHQGHLYAARRGRRVSKEFEDVDLHSRSKAKFLSVEEDHGLEHITRRRVYSMSHVQHPRRRPDRVSMTHSNHTSPGTSPDLRKKVLKKKGSNSSGSRESCDSLSSLDNLHWIGDPEAIHSIRRPRKTVEEQELESELHRMQLK